MCQYGMLGVRRVGVPQRRQFNDLECHGEEWRHLKHGRKNIDLRRAVLTLEYIDRLDSWNLPLRAQRRKRPLWNGTWSEYVILMG